MLVIRILQFLTSASRIVSAQLGGGFANGEGSANVIRTGQETRRFQEFKTAQRKPAEPGKPSFLVLVFFFGIFLFFFRNSGQIIKCLICF